jgi:protein ImuA
MRDLFAPALAGVGLHPDRVIFAEVGDEKMVLLCLEEGPRHAGLAGVVGEVARVSMTNLIRLLSHCEQVRRTRHSATERSAP